MFLKVWSVEYEEGLKLYWSNFFVLINEMFFLFVFNIIEISLVFLSFVVLIKL